MESQPHPARAHEPGTGLEQHRAAFEECVVAILPDLLGAAIRLVKNRADAEDLVADTVARAWQRLESLRDLASLRGWMFRILTNVFLSAQRAHAASPGMESLSAEGDEAAFSIFERLHQPFLLWWNNPEQEFLNKLLREDLLRALNGLPDEFRVVVVLADVEGQSYQEIATALGVPIGTARSRLARARGRLQKELWAHAVEVGLAPPRGSSGEPAT